MTYHVDNLSSIASILDKTRRYLGEGHLHVFDSIGVRANEKDVLHIGELYSTAEEPGCGEGDRLKFWQIARDVCYGSRS